MMNNSDHRSDDERFADRLIWIAIVCIVLSILILVSGFVTGVKAQVSRQAVCEEPVKAGLLAIWADTFAGQPLRGTVQYEHAFTWDGKHTTFYAGGQNQIYITYWEGVRAVFHTHPDGVEPEPSKQDAQVAAQRNVYVYTLARTGIWRVGPSGLVVFVSRYGMHQMLVPSGSGGVWKVSRWEPEVCWDAKITTAAKGDK